MKKKLPYLYTCIISLAILLIIFYLKKIYPFGEYSLVWGDMYDQIMSFYFHMYDSFYDSISLLYNNTSGSGLNFFGVAAYYILSPVNLILLAFPREQLYGAITIVCMIKIVLCSITSLYFIKTYFKKLPTSISVLLSLCYAFSNYMLVNYTITAWIDAMYLFPLILIGLKRVLDLDNPKMYIITLSISIICSFYVSFISLIFILLVSLIYVYVFREKGERKKAITALGLSTVLAIAISCVVIVPTYLQLSQSSRVDFSLKTLLTSKTGPITEKFALFAGGGILYTAILLLLKEHKEHKKFLNFYIPVMILLLIPIVIEPIHKLWHFGSYTFWPYRYGYITFFFFVIGAAYFFENIRLRANNKSIFKIITVLCTLGCSVVYIVLAFKFKSNMQNAIFNLALSKYTKVKLFLVVMLVLSFIPSFVDMFFYNKYSRKLVILSTIVCIFCSSYIFLGMDSYGDGSLKVYKDYISLSKIHNNGDYFRVKQDLVASSKIFNSGMISRYHSIDQFTSLTNRNTLETMKELGYSSYWVNTNSKGSNMFIDALLANKYLITSKQVDTDYYTLMEGYNTFNMYRSNNNISYGYLLNEVSTINDKENSFVRSNAIYKDITGDEGLFSTYEFDLSGIKKEEINKEYKYSKEIEEAYFVKELDIHEKSEVYLEIFRSLNNSLDHDNYGMFDIYVNDKLYEDKAFTIDENNVFDLGSFTNQKVVIKIKLLGDVTLKNIVLGVMDNSKFINFINNNHLNTKISYNRNKINVSYKSEEEKILFLPITYSRDFKVTNNNKDISILKVYDNYIGIKLDKGENDISLTYVPNGLNVSLIISIIAILLTIVLLHTSLYDLIISNKIINSITYFSYMFAYFQLALLHLFLLGAFFASYFIK